MNDSELRAAFLLGFYSRLPNQRVEEQEVVEQVQILKEAMDQLLEYFQGGVASRVQELLKDYRAAINLSDGAELQALTSKLDEMIDRLLPDDSSARSILQEIGVVLAHLAAKADSLEESEFEESVADLIELARRDPVQNHQPQILSVVENLREDFQWSKNMGADIGVAIEGAVNRCELSIVKSFEGQAQSPAILELDLQNKTISVYGVRIDCDSTSNVVLLCLKVLMENPNTPMTADEILQQADSEKLSDSFAQYISRIRRPIKKGCKEHVASVDRELTKLERRGFIETIRKSRGDYSSRSKYKLSLHPNEVKVVSH
jgi:hypothetical protein